MRRIQEFMAVLKAAALRASCRNEQRIQILVMHKPSDPLSVGAAGSPEVAIAKDLLALCSTRVLFGQSTRVADDLAEDLPLTGQEQRAITGWAMDGVGRALWKIENRPGYKVQTVLSPTATACRKNTGQVRSRASSCT